MKLPYATKVLLFSVIIGLLTFLVFNFALEEYYLNIFPYIIIFFLLIAIIFHTIIVRLSKRNIARFSSYYMLSTTVKLLTYIVFIVIYLLSNRQHAIPFVVYFFVLYVFYTAFEVILVLPEIKNKQT